MGPGGVHNLENARNCEICMFCTVQCHKPSCTRKKFTQVTPSLTSMRSYVSRDRKFVAKDNAPWKEVPRGAHKFNGLIREALSLAPSPRPAFRHYVLQATKSWVEPGNEARRFYCIWIIIIVVILMVRK